MVPLHFYPEVVQSIALHTPFAAMLYGPGSLLFFPSMERFVEVALLQLFWLAVSVLVLILVATRAIAFATAEGRG